MTVRQRVLRIRRIVAVCAVTVFIAVFATIYVQMAAGNDPALGATSANVSSASSSGSSSSSGSDSSSGSSSDQPATVTTSPS
jgi:hypothetical protein